MYITHIHAMVYAATVWRLQQCRSKRVLAICLASEIVCRQVSPNSSR